MNTLVTRKDENKHAREKRATAYRVNSGGLGKRWIGNTVYYEILRNEFTSKEINLIFEGIKPWEKHTCVKFKQSSNAKNRIQFKRGKGGCYSRMGMVGGVQDLGLSPHCPEKALIMHEVGHALGLWHEHNRPDRDSYITVVYNNIVQRFRTEFKKLTYNAAQTLGVSYDYLSIMHYGKASGTTNGADTMIAKDSRFQNIMGNAKGLSFKDIKTMNIMYNCKRHKPGCTLDDSQCPGYGFVSKDCTCLCAGPNWRQPTRKCQGQVKPNPSKPTTVICADKHRQCANWASNGECNKNKRWMHPNCIKSCGLCQTGNCVDKHASCVGWARIGECHKNPGWMKSNCMKSCAICSPVATKTTAKPYRPQPSNTCTDKHIRCKQWARLRECFKNPRWMKDNCEKSCGGCV